MADLLTEILQAASKHPNSRVAKLIQLVEEERTQKNIVLLLIELADHAEYSVDFNISLKYYLDLFERLGINHDLVLNEAGLLLVNSSKIYSKRVDYVQSLVERQILTLSNADDELQKQRLEHQENGNLIPTEKPKRSRKRPLEVPSDPYEIELVPKKFKKLTEEKRFAAPKIVPKPKCLLRNIELEQQIHPACWQYATICDFENEDDVDTKRNYKLFTYHIEHRYNTLVPDINFRLHFKVKDYMDELEEMEEVEDCDTDRSWPPLSEEYIQKYLRLENYVLQQGNQASKQSFVDQLERRRKETDVPVSNMNPVQESHHNLNASSINRSISCNVNTELEQSTLDLSVVNTSIESELNNDSGLSKSVLDETNNFLDNNQNNCSLETTTNLSLTESSKSINPNESQTGCDSALGTSVLDQSSGITDNNTTEIACSLNSTENRDHLTNSQLENDSALGTSVLEKHNTTAENSSIIEEEANKSLNGVENQTENDSTLEVCGSSNDTNIENLEKSGKNINESTAESNRNVEAVVKEEDITVELTKIIDNRIDAEEVNKNDDESGKRLKIDVIQQQDKNTTQIRFVLPNGDDEGVYLSDLEEQYDCRLLSPVINIHNILPGVKRKDITIVVDEELREALEMRDGIIKHFGREKFTVPVLTQEKNQNLIFNVLKLPEKMLRKKVLFKLGPDMDIYLQARTLKRSRPESITRIGRKDQIKTWYSLNDTDMTGVYMTPPTSAGHCSDFCGFSDSPDDTTSCAEFHGFTEEEQSKLSIEAISRLSRDSGVGVDANNLENLCLERWKGNFNPDETESAGNMLSQLPADIREVLSTELEGNRKDNSATSSKSGDVVAESSSKFNENLLTLNNSEGTQESDNILTADFSEHQTCTEEITINNESIEITESQKKSSDSETDKQNSTIISQNSEFQLSSDELSNTEKPISSAENIQVSDDDMMLDLNTQGIKTKIQRWHEHLQPILAKSRERHHFDVFKLGSEIIDTVQSKGKSTAVSSSNRTTTFHDIMDNKDKSYVSRYFLSTLLLANQSNIEISIQNKTPEKPTSWQDINLQLLSTKRHTVAIEDNIGMIDIKQNSRCRGQNLKDNSNTIQNSTRNNNQDDSEKDSTLIKVQSMKKASTKSKPSLKRSISNSATTSFVADKKSKDISFLTCTTNSRHKELPHLSERVQTENPPFSNTPSTVYTSMMPSTSRQAHKTNNALFDININAIRTLQPIEKVQQRCDDIDSGIFSLGEMSTS